MKTINNKPHWQTQHDWWVSDFEFEYRQMWELRQLLRRHPKDSVGLIFGEMIEMIKERIKMMVKEYERIYGDKPRLTEIKMKVENRQEYKAYRRSLLMNVINDYAALEDDYYRLKAKEGA